MNKQFFKTSKFALGAVFAAVMLTLIGALWYFYQEKNDLSTQINECSQSKTEEVAELESQVLELSKSQAEASELVKTGESSLQECKSALEEAETLPESVDFTCEYSKVPRGYYREVEILGYAGERVSFEAPVSWDVYTETYTYSTEDGEILSLDVSDGESSLGYPLSQFMFVLSNGKPVHMLSNTDADMGEIRGVIGTFKKMDHCDDDVTIVAHNCYTAKEWYEASQHSAKLEEYQFSYFNHFIVKNRYGFNAYHSSVRGIDGEVSEVYMIDLPSNVDNYGRKLVLEGLKDSPELRHLVDTFDFEGGAE